MLVLLEIYHNQIMCKERITYKDVYYNIIYDKRGIFEYVQASSLYQNSEMKLIL